MSTAQPTVTILLNLGSMFGITTGATQRSSRNTGFGMFGQSIRTSNLGWQSFKNLEGNNPSVGNNNGNNLPLSPLSVNLFGNIGGFNPPPNNNKNLSPGGLDLNVTALVNALTGMNLMGGHYLREGSFIKLTEFRETETEDLNEWLERFNRIAEAN